MYDGGEGGGVEGNGGKLFEMKEDEVHFYHGFPDASSEATPITPLSSKPQSQVRRQTNLDTSFDCEVRWKVR
jgi:hypothetical protein